MYLKEFQGRMYFKSKMKKNIRNGRIGSEIFLVGYVCIALSDDKIMPPRKSSVLRSAKRA